MRDSLIDLAAVLDAAAQPMLVVDGDAVIRFANPAAAAALGYDGAGELVGRDSAVMLHLLRATGETVARDLDWFVRRDGSTIPVSYASAPIELADGRGVVVTFNDAEAHVRGERLRHEHEEILWAQRRWWRGGRRPSRCSPPSRGRSAT